METPASGIEELDFPLDRVSRSVPFLDAALRFTGDRKTDPTLPAVPHFGHGMRGSGVLSCGAACDDEEDAMDLWSSLIGENLDDGS
jgi:hypothetical protein